MSTGWIWAGNVLFVTLTLTRELRQTEVEIEWTLTSGRLMFEYHLHQMDSVTLITLVKFSELLLSSV